MATDYEICFDEIIYDLYLYDSKLIPVSFQSGDTISITMVDFTWTIPLDKFLREGFRILNDRIFSPRIRIQCGKDIIVGNSHPHKVYRIDGFISDFSDDKKEIKNFDKMLGCMYESDKILKISGDFLKNFGNVKKINYLFGDQREWRGVSDTSDGLKIHELPASLMQPLVNLEELNGSFSNLDNVLSIPMSFLDNNRKLRSLRAFNDCRVLMDVKGATVTSQNLEYVVMCNNLMNVCFIPSALINTGASGNMFMSCFLNCNPNLLKVTFDSIVNTPNKRIFFASDLVVNKSKANRIVNCLVIEYGNHSTTVATDADIVTTWKTFFETRVLPLLRNENDMGGVKVLKARSVEYSIAECPVPINGLLFLDTASHPAGLYPGTVWEQIQNRFILGAGSRSSGSTGGAESVALTEGHMPRHNHRVDNHSHGIDPHRHIVTNYFSLESGFNDPWASGGSDRVEKWQNFYTQNQEGGTGTHGSAPYTDSKGSGAAFSIMPPFYVTFIWKRKG
ncbi:MAG: phage baseplate protein [Peptostreptococcaceae bacterium]